MLIAKVIIMLTIHPEVIKSSLRTDNTYNVKLRFTLNRKTKRLSTNLFVKPKELTRSLKFKEGSQIKHQVNELVTFYREKCFNMKVEQDNLSLEDIFNRFEEEKGKNRKIDFIEFSQRWIDTTKSKGKMNYQSALNSFKKFLNADTLDIRDFNKDILVKFVTYLETNRVAKEKKLQKEGKRIPSHRAPSLYIGSLRHLFREAQLHYNDYDKNIICIPHDPFRAFKAPKQEGSRKRALPADVIKNIWALPYQQNQSAKRTNRFNLAKDCFILSFCLIGMNSADLYNATTLSENLIIYNRTKTKDRRTDKALMKVQIPEIIKPLLKKYEDKSGKRIFNFHKLYVDSIGFNRALNLGLKEIGKILNIEDLEFYAARHSWATIAVNKVKIDKYTVHSALNHVDESMKVTDIYIDRDFSIENEANSKVIQYVFGNK